METWAGLTTWPEGSPENLLEKTLFHLSFKDGKSQPSTRGWEGTPGSRAFQVEAV